MLETKVAAFLEKHSFSLSKKRIVVGVSGGPDSLALLHFLWLQKEKQDLSLIAAHVDHMFRGEESFQDALFVKDFCRQHGIPFVMEQINVPSIIEQTGKSPEAAGREARYDFFAKVMKKTNYPYLALAHHGDDQIETILMRFTRGSTGLARAGIRFLRPVEKGMAVRPFLCLTKDEILEYCSRYQLIPRFDPSNEEGIYSRNRFRKAILPFLKAENPQVHEHFQRFSEEMDGDESFLQELTSRSMEKVFIRKDRRKVTIDINHFHQMPMPLQRRGIQLILNYLYIERPASLSAVHIDTILSLLQRLQPSGALDFPEGLKVVRSYGQCHFQFGLFEFHSYEMSLEKPGVYDLPGGRQIEMEYTDSPFFPTDSRSALFAFDQLKVPLIVRTRKNGDRMSLKGMSGTRKLKDIFIDYKIPIHDRDLWPVVTDREGSILWLPGLKKSASEGVSSNTGYYIQLTYI